MTVTIGVMIITTTTIIAMTAGTVTIIDGCNQSEFAPGRH
jgi:hypothetical protein